MKKYLHTSVNNLCLRIYNFILFVKKVLNYLNKCHFLKIMLTIETYERYRGGSPPIWNGENCGLMALFSFVSLGNEIPTKN